MKLSQVLTLAIGVGGAAVATEGCDRTPPPRPGNEQATHQDGTDLVRREQEARGRAVERLLAQVDGGMLPSRRQDGGVNPPKVDGGQGGPDPDPNQGLSPARPERLTAPYDGALPEVPGHKYALQLRAELERLFGTATKTALLRNQLETLMGTLIAGIHGTEGADTYDLQGAAEIVFPDNAPEGQSGTKKALLDFLWKLSPDQLDGLYQAIKTQIIEPMGNEEKVAFLKSLQSLYQEWQAGEAAFTKYKGILGEHKRWLDAKDQIETKLGDGRTDEKIEAELAKQFPRTNAMHAEYEISRLGLTQREGIVGIQTGRVVRFIDSVMKRPNGGQKLAQLKALIKKAAEELGL